MKDTIKFGIGFVTGRPNVCKIINNTYERLINQFKDFDKKEKILAASIFWVESTNDLVNQLTLVLSINTAM